MRVFFEFVERNLLLLGTISAAITLLGAWLSAWGTPRGENAGSIPPVPKPALPGLDAGPEEITDYGEATGWKKPFPIVFHVPFHKTHVRVRGTVINTDGRPTVIVGNHKSSLRNRRNIGTKALEKLEEALSASAPQVV